MSIAGEYGVTCAAGALIMVLLCFGTITSSLWLDETGTWWIVKDGPKEVIGRALSWSGQSPLYYLIAWISSRLFGLNEIALRLPSVLAMAGAIYYLYRIADRLMDRTAAITSSFAFLCIGYFFGTDARPYALGFLCLTASTFFLLQWVDHGRPSHAALCMTASALLVYAHPVLSISLAAGVFWAAVSLRREPRRLGWLAGMQIAVMLLCIPLLGELRTFYADRAAHSLIPAPSFVNLVPVLIPGGLAGSVILVVWLCMSLGREVSVAGRCQYNAFILIGAWSWLAPVALYLLAVCTDVRLLLPRYYSSAYPGQALLLGWLLASIKRKPLRDGLCVAVATVVILNSGKLAGQTHGNENWRDALASVRADAGPAPVLFVSGFVEASGFDRISDPRMRDILFAPELLYGEPARSIRLPKAFRGAANPEMVRIARELRRERRFFLVKDNPEPSYEMWLLKTMDSAGVRCKSETTGNRFGYVLITRFTCE